MTVQLLGADLSPFFDPNAEGLFFTTVNPALGGLDPNSDFATIFIGETDTVQLGLLGLASHVDVANMDKADEAIIFVESFRSIVSPEITTTNPAEALNQHSRALANVIAHELGHLLGMNHTEGGLIQDDPDNNPATPSDVNLGTSLISAGPNVSTDSLISELNLLGTSPIESSEFTPIGVPNVPPTFIVGVDEFIFLDPTASQAVIDQATSLLLWVS